MQKVCFSRFELNYFFLNENVYDVILIVSWQTSLYNSQESGRQANCCQFSKLQVNQRRAEFLASSTAEFVTSLLKSVKKLGGKFKNLFQIDSLVF